jgi:hypothetical protein
MYLIATVSVSFAYVYMYFAWLARRYTDGDGDVPVAEHGVQLEDDGLLVGCDLAPLQVRPEVVHPPEPAALPAPAQPCTQTRCHIVIIYRSVHRQRQ